MAKPSLLNIAIFLFGTSLIPVLFKRSSNILFDCLIKGKSGRDAVRSVRV